MPGPWAQDFQCSDHTLTIGLAMWIWTACSTGKSHGSLNKTSSGEEWGGDPRHPKTHATGGPGHLRAWHG